MLYSLTPYLQFDGNAEEVLEYYESALDGKITMKTLYLEIPQDDGNPMPQEFMDKMADKICHAEIYIGKFLIMAADGCAPENPQHGQIALTLSSDDAEETTKYFNALKEGATVRMPLAKTFWSPLFGSLVDKYGITWSFNTLTKEEIARLLAANEKIGK